MALSAHIQFGDNQAGRYNKDYLLVDCRCSYRRSHNDLRPDGRAQCDSVEITVVSPAKEDMTLFDWFMNGDEMSGRIVFDLSSLSTDDSNPEKILYFEDARCFALEESYDKDTRFRRLLRLSFEADKISTEEIDFNKD
ncbi:MAG: hypothetical protein J5884_00725 [Paludibacteraceae bacterium]|nr:hypothetical protein [Paludibacteraceae bacterium]